MVNDVLPMVANFLPTENNVLLLVNNVLPMVTHIYLMVAEDSSVANPQKVAKLMKNEELATLLLKQSMNYRIPQYFGENW
jgi:hypothetical protein